MILKNENGLIKISREYEIEGDPYIEIVKTFGNGCRINCSKKYEGKRVLVAILK